MICYLILLVGSSKILNMSNDVGGLLNTSFAGFNSSANDRSVTIIL